MHRGRGLAVEERTRVSRGRDGNTWGKIGGLHGAEAGERHSKAGPGQLD